MSKAVVHHTIEAANPFNIDGTNKSIAPIEPLKPLLTLGQFDDSAADVTNARPTNAGQEM